MGNDYNEKNKNADPVWTPGQAPYGQQKKGFKNFIWNPETNEFLGRTGLSWLKITIFYLCFYAALATFFLTSLKIALMINVVDEHPKWTLTESLIGSNPGIGYRPMPDQESNVESTLIWINRDAEKEKSFWADELNKFIGTYSESTGGVKCSHENPASINSSCIVNVEQILECNHTTNFGYTPPADNQNVIRPCVLIKLNRIYNWKPESYVTRDDLKLAEERGMPKDLQDRIEKLIVRAENNDVKASQELQTVWVSCDGENPADIENIGEKKYYAPGMSTEFPGIPNYYFPYLNQEGYMSPFVFVKFNSLQHHALINIRCKGWAKNIITEVTERKGLVHFEFLID